ncbi:MAG: hypothetical protein JW995_15735 [Melioribacteraceae bacterium]|nr:hypothetical protein [Melioribacteraceae bacterium]
MRSLIQQMILIYFICAVAVSAQDDYKKWLESQRKEFQNFLSEDDKKFIGFLEQEWKEFALLAGEKPDQQPKPVKIPQASVKEPVKSKPEVVRIQPPKSVSEKPQQKQPQNIEPDQKGDLPADPNTATISFPFFTSEEKLSIPMSLSVTPSQDLSVKTIADFYKNTANTNYKKTLENIIHRKTEMALNDWGYILYLKSLAEKIYPDNNDNRHLLVWFWLIKSGYKAKVGIINGSVRLFLPTKNKLYGIPYFAGSDDARLFVFNLDNLGERIEGSLLSYNEDYPEAVKLIDMNIEQSPRISDDFITRELTFTYEGKKYLLAVEYDVSAVHFYKYYPYSNLEIYFNAAVSECFAGNIISQLKEITKNLSSPSAANIILRFVQTAFDYKTDDVNFGREKPLFPEETIHYQFSDCEDRSVLFAYLVKNVLDLPVIGVDYPGHVATAVLFNTVVDGDKVRYNNKHYTICDPTYINAYIGMSQEEFRNAAIENLIELR